MRRRAARRDGRRVSENTVTLEARIAELEAKLTLSEDALDELNRTVYRQQQELNELRKSMQKALIELKREISESGPAEPRDLRDEIPPHY